MADVTVTSDVHTFMQSANQAAMRTNIGAGTIATQNANNVSITGGSITGITDLAIADGGTGAGTAAAARTNLEVYSDAEVDAKVATKAVAGGIEFDGLTTSYVEIPATSIGNIFTNEGSFSFYAKIDDISLNQAIFDCRNGSGVGGFGIFYRDDQKIRFVHETSGTVLMGEATTTINEGEWFHCVITHDGTVDSSAPIFFINGVQLVTSAFTTASGTIGTVPPSVGRFGEVVTGSPGGILGSIKNALFFNRALSAAEVTDLYESGTVAVADRWGNPTPVYESDFTVNEDGWVSINGATVSANTGNNTLEITQTTGNSGAVQGLFIGKQIQRIEWSAKRVSGDSAPLTCQLRSSGGSTVLTNIAKSSNVTWNGSLYTFSVLDTEESYWVEFIASSEIDSLFLRLQDTPLVATTFQVSDIKITQVGCIADLPLDEGIGYQFHDRSSNHFDALASTTGVTHLVPKQTGKVRVKAANASSAMYMLRADSILPTDSIISNVLSEQRYVDLTNSAQTLDDYRIRLNPSGSDLQIQRSDGSNHATLGTVTAPSSLSNVDVEVHYEQVAR
jgi:hypothetical protein